MATTMSVMVRLVFVSHQMIAYQQLRYSLADAMRRLLARPMCLANLHEAATQLVVDSDWVAKLMEA
jgi:hypothetical protein